MRKKIWLALILSVVLSAGVKKGWCQNASPERPPDVREYACRLDFSLNELEDGKKINVRHYSLNVTGGGYKQLKIGTRVPVEAEQGKFQYLDVGTNIQAKTYGSPDAPILDVIADISNFAIPDQGTHSGGQPLVRQMVISSNTMLLFDKPMIIGSVDDPNSKRSFQLEVVATKLK